MPSATATFSIAPSYETTPTPILSTFLGTVNSVSLLQKAKACAPIVRNESGKVILSILSNEPKAELPISSSPSASHIRSTPSQLKNAFVSILSTDGGKVINLIACLEEKASSPMPATGTPLYDDGIIKSSTSVAEPKPVTVALSPAISICKL